jgi:beta-mannosidase
MKSTLFFTCLFGLLALPGRAQPRQQISLNEHWIVKPIAVTEATPTSLPGDFKAPGKDWYAGNMPKQVQEFVFERGELPDPHVGDNVALWLPAFEQDWVYCKRFPTPRFPGKIALCFMGLDTEVDIYLNGQKIAACDNMFRRWTVPVTQQLRGEGEENLLLLRFRSPRHALRQLAARHDQTDFKVSKYLRKCISDFSAYMGSRPDFLKMGIFDAVYLDLLPAAHFGEVYVRSELTGDFSQARLFVAPDVQQPQSAGISYELFSPAGQSLAKADLKRSDAFEIPVAQPELWWPMAHGAQPLYTLKLRLHTAGRALDEKEIKFGLREVKPVFKDEKTGEPRFGFRINGRMIFMHGACWAPLEGFTHVWDEKRAARLFELMKLGNFNFLRVWGEGSIPDRKFFEQCDRDGIVVWMDFMTAGGIRFPLDDAGFVANIRAEIADVIKRLRNHPSLAVWCGGNEHYLGAPSNQGDNTKPLGRELLQKIMPELVAQHDPQRYFHPSSPWGGDNWPNGNHPLVGDFHDYNTIRFQPLSDVPLFMSEVCMISPYSAHNMRRFIPEGQFWPEGFRFTIDKPGKIAWPASWRKHTTGSSWEKMGRIQDFCDIQNAEDACRVFGTAHGHYLRDVYERLRRGVPDGQPDGNRRSWGAAIWRLNDTWPIIYMSVVDYYNEPKIPYYFLKRSCEPVLVSFEQTPDKICVWVVNDTARPLNDTLTVELWTFAGKMKQRVTQPVALPATASKRVMDLTPAFHEIRRRDEFMVARLGDQVVSHLLGAEKFLKLSDGVIQVRREKDTLIFSAQVFIKDVALSLPAVAGAVFSDNYFNLIPGEEKRVKIIADMGGKSLQIQGVNSSMITLDL